MRRLSIAALIAAALAAVSVSAASAQVLGKPNPGPPPQAQFHADWNGGATCVYTESATCSATATGSWVNAPGVRSVEFQFNCQEGISGSGNYYCESNWTPDDITVNSRVPGSSGGSANTAFSFQDWGCVYPGHYFTAYFKDARGRTLGSASSGNLSSCLA